MAATKTTAAKRAKSAVKTAHVRKDVDPNTIVTVKNGFTGKLVYVSKKTGERFLWEAFGDEQDMTFAELKNARNASKAFFENNWFLIDAPDVIEALGAEDYYDNALSYDEFSTLFDLSPKEMTERIAKLSEGQKASVKYRARQLAADGEIDSIKSLEALEKALNTTLRPVAE